MTTAAVICDRDLAFVSSITHCVSVHSRHPALSTPLSLTSSTHEFNPHNDIPSTRPTTTHPPHPLVNPRRLDPDSPLHPPNPPPHLRNPRPHRLQPPSERKPLHHPLLLPLLQSGKPPKNRRLQSPRRAPRPPPADLPPGNLRGPPTWRRDAQLGQPRASIGAGEQDAGGPRHNRHASDQHGEQDCGDEGVLRQCDF